MPPQLDLLRRQALRDADDSPAHHQAYPESPASKAEAIDDFRRLSELIKRLLGTEIGLTSKIEPTLFARPIHQGELSSGQKVLLRLAVKLHVAIDRDDLVLTLLRQSVVGTGLL